MADGGPGLSVLARPSACRWPACCRDRRQPADQQTIRDARRVNPCGCSPRGSLPASAQVPRGSGPSSRRRQGSWGARRSRPSVPAPGARERCGHLPLPAAGDLRQDPGGGRDAEPVCGGGGGEASRDDAADRRARPDEMEARPAHRDATEGATASALTGASRDRRRSGCEIRHYMLPSARYSRQPPAS